MKASLIQFIVCLLSYVCCINGLAGQGDGDDKKTTTSATSVWVTITSDGELVTVQTKFSQSFMTTHSTANLDSVESGNVGLGSSQTGGSVGDIRSYERTTISNTNGGNTVGVYSGMVGVIAVGLGLL